MKNRDDIYLVVREGEGSYVVCEAHASLEEADNRVDAYNQKFRDKGLDHVWKFVTQITTFYNE